jgi:hypothetical protein
METFFDNGFADRGVIQFLRFINLVRPARRRYGSGNAFEIVIDGADDIALMICMW